MVGMELTIANKNSECGNMPYYAIFCVCVIMSHSVAHLKLSSCSVSIVDLNVGKILVSLFANFRLFARIARYNVRHVMYNVQMNTMSSVMQSLYVLCANRA
jgi:hypothetical protein